MHGKNHHAPELGISSRFNAAVSDASANPTTGNTATSANPAIVRQHRHPYTGQPGSACPGG